MLTRGAVGVHVGESRFARTFFCFNVVGRFGGLNVSDAAAVLTVGDGVLRTLNVNLSVIGTNGDDSKLVVRRASMGHLAALGALLGRTWCLRAA